MWIAINLTLKWILLGIVFSLLLAGAGSGGTSAINLLPSGVLIFIMCFSILENLKVQTNCISFEGNAYVKARSQVEELGWSHSFLKPKAHELNACELGFEYKNSDHFKLFIVSPDGSVRLND